MLNSKPIEKVIFLDIETTSSQEDFSMISPTMRKIFYQKFIKDKDEKLCEVLAQSEHSPEENITNILYAEGADKKFPSIRKRLNDKYGEKAPLHPEFGKIVCISIGTLSQAEDKYKLTTTSFSSFDEKSLLEGFLNRIKKVSSGNEFAFCAHNGKSFDFPYIAKRLIINGIDLPKVFDFAELKPWEQTFIDTKDTWRFGVYDAHSSLELLCEVFGVKTSKDDMSGADVKDVFYVEKDIKKIEKYCEKDIYSLASIYLKMKNIHAEIV